MAASGRPSISTGTSRSARSPAAELEANRIVWENRPVAIRYATAEEAAALPLRKESVRAGTLRLIEIPDFDLSACGGTHVAQTGAVGMVAITAWERFKGGTRVEFVCGGRALQGFRDRRDTLASASRLMSVAPSDVPAAVGRLQDESREQRRVGALLNAELVGLRADRLAAGAEIVARGRLVHAAVDTDANGLKALASALVTRPGYLAVLTSTARPAQVVVARAVDVDVSARDVLASLASRFGGRGGGKPDLAQGGGFDAEPEAILAEARRLLTAS